MDDAGLPDFVGDHFNYLVRSSLPIRVGQGLFFISGLTLPVMMLLALPDIYGNKILESFIPLILTAVVFVVSLIWHLSWIEMRRHRFRTEKPASYARWFGWKNRRLASRDPLGQIGLLKLQMRYMFFGKEPSQVETLELTMRLVRRNA